MHHLSICSKCGYGHSSATCVTDDEVVAWFDSQAEEFLAALPGYEDGLTPRSAWNTFFSSSPATETAPASSPAPVVAGQGEGTNLCEPDYVVVRASELRLVRLQLSVAVDRSAHGLGRVQGAAALSQLLVIEGKSIPLDELLLKCREGHA